MPDYDFNWQSVYRFEKPLHVPKGSKLTWIGRWDNSADNPRNPDPKKAVFWGLQTWDEMQNGWMEVVWKKPKSEPVSAQTREIRLDELCRISGVTRTGRKSRATPIAAARGREGYVMMMQIQFTADHERCLREQAITADQPGTVLHDFEMLLDFLKDQGGVEAAGKYNLLPLKFIDELDHRLSRPLRLEMKRPQIKSHPYLQGLHLLLRASGLTRVEGTGAKARLLVDPELVAPWNQLNPTEQYFNLLEAWLRFGRSEMIGEEAAIGGDMAPRCIEAWRSLPEEGEKFDTQRPTEVLVAGIYRDFYQLALMDLFGLVEVELPRHAVTPWCPAGVKRLPFGDAVWSVLYPQSRQSLMRTASSGMKPRIKRKTRCEEPRFGAWQPLFQPYFPEWRENLKLPEVGAARRHVPVPRVLGQGLAVDRPSGRRHAGRPAALGTALVQIRQRSPLPVHLSRPEWGLWSGSTIRRPVNRP